MEPEDIARCDPLDVPEEWKKRALDELNEDPETARSNIEELRRLVQSEKNLYAQTDDLFLMAFLRARKHNVGNAFKLIKNFYNLKRQYPKHIEDCLPSEKGFAYDMNGFTLLPDRDQCGRRVFGVRVEEVDLSRVKQEHFFQLLFTLAMVQVHDPLVQIAGVVALVDLTGLTLSKAAIVTPTFARIALHIMQDSFPLRVKAIHVVFEPFYFDAIYALFKPFLREKLKRRIFLHGYNLSTLHTGLSRRILPPSLEGFGADWDFETFRRDIGKLEEVFRGWRKYGYGKKPEEHK